MTEIRSFRAKKSPELARISHRIRQEVFVDEQHVDPALEYDEHENEAMHYLLFHEGEAVATARWRETDKGIKLERFATLLSIRNQGIGSILLDHVLREVSKKGKTVYASGLRDKNDYLPADAILFNTMFGRQFTDIFSGYRVFSRRFVKSFPAVSAGFDARAHRFVDRSTADGKEGSPCGVERN